MENEISKEDLEFLENWNQMEIKERWDFVIDNQDLDIVVHLDYENTWVRFLNKYYLDFIFENGTGFVSLLDRLNIKYKLNI